MLTAQAIGKLLWPGIASVPQRIESHRSLATAKQAEIVLDTDLAGWQDAMNPVEHLLSALAACMLKGIERVAPLPKFQSAASFPRRMPAVGWGDGSWPSGLQASPGVPPPAVRQGASGRYPRSAQVRSGQLWQAPDDRKADRTGLARGCRRVGRLMRQNAISGVRTRKFKTVADSGCGQRLRTAVADSDRGRQYCSHDYRKIL